MLANGKDDLMALQERDARTCVQSMVKRKELGAIADALKRVGAKAGGGGGERRFRSGGGWDVTC